MNLFKGATRVQISRWDAHENRRVPLEVEEIRRQTKLLIITESGRRFSKATGKERGIDWSLKVAEPIL